MKRIAKVWVDGDPDCCVDVECYWGADTAARDACDVFWSEHDGSEWMQDGGLVLFVEINGEVTKHSIELDWSPNWYASMGEPVEAIDPPAA